MFTAESKLQFDLFMVMFVHGIYRNLCFSCSCIKSPRNVYIHQCKLVYVLVTKSAFIFTSIRARVYVSSCLARCLIFNGNTSIKDLNLNMSFY